ncbi:MAG TPA: DUF882 domain-containing protein [Azospirillum sp.]
MSDECGQSNPAPALGRRELLRLGIGAAAAATILQPAESLAMIKAPPRQLSMLNLHTGERISAEYWSKGRYVRSAVQAISRVLRDHRTGAVHAIDPKLLDVLHQIHRRTGGRGPLHIISGYRSPESNAALREADGDGVAQFSYHMQGKAIDLRVPGMPLRQLHKLALGMRAGGVGYYPHSNFVHIDTGPLRKWHGA